MNQKDIEIFKKQKMDIIEEFSAKNAKLDADNKALKKVSNELSRKILSDKSLNQKQGRIIGDAKKQADLIVSDAKVLAGNIEKDARKLAEDLTDSLNSSKKEYDKLIIDLRAQKDKAREEAVKYETLKKEIISIKKKHEEAISDCYAKEKEFAAKVIQSENAKKLYEDRLKENQDKQIALNEKEAKLIQKEAFLNDLQVKLNDLELSLDKRKYDLEEGVSKKLGEIENIKGDLFKQQEEVKERNKALDWRNVELDKGFELLDIKTKETNKNIKKLEGLKKELSKKGA